MNESRKQLLVLCPYGYGYVALMLPSPADLSKPLNPTQKTSPPSSSNSARISLQSSQRETSWQATTLSDSLGQVLAVEGFGPDVTEMTGNISMATRISLRLEPLFGLLLNIFHMASVTIFQCRSQHYFSVPANFAVLAKPLRISSWLWTCIRALVLRAVLFLSFLLFQLALFFLLLL